MSADPTVEQTKPQMSAMAHIAAGWPMALVAVGGLIGGACGGAAYGISISIFKKRGATVSTYIYATLIGIAAVALYFAVIIGLGIAFPEMFKR